VPSFSFSFSPITSIFLYLLFFFFFFPFLFFFFFFIHFTLYAIIFYYQLIIILLPSRDSFALTLFCLHFRIILPRPLPTLSPNSTTFITLYSTHIILTPLIPCFSFFALTCYICLHMCFITPLFLLQNFFFSTHSSFHFPSLHIHKINIAKYYIYIYIIF